MTKLFVKPNLTPRQVIENLDKEIYLKTKQYEDLVSNYETMENTLKSSYEESKAIKEKELNELDTLVNLKKAERAELEKPLTERANKLDEREKELEDFNSELLLKDQRIFQRELEAESTIKSAQDLIDDINEKGFNLNKREKIITRKEEVIKEKENDLIKRIDEQNISISNKEKQLNEKEEDLRLISLALKGKEENIEQREIENQKELELIKSQRESLIIAQKLWHKKEQGL